jgi:DNA processing protein
MTTAIQERAALLVLLKHASAGWGEIARRTLAAKSALAVAAEDGLLARQLFAADDEWERDLAAAEAAVTTWSESGLRLLTVLDADYPVRLLDISQPPPFIFCVGEQAAQDASGVAVVGARRATADTLAATAGIARELAEAGRAVISGLAAGVDTAAHAGALAVGGRTVGVVGTGLAKSYPAVNRELQARIGREGLLVSRFWPEASPSKISFPMRNEVMSAWAAATLVMQADSKSGARMQARVALQQGRELLLWKTMVAEPWAVEYVQAGKAHFVESAADVLARV